MHLCACIHVFACMSLLACLLMFAHLPVLEHLHVLAHLSVLAWIACVCIIVCACMNDYMCLYTCLCLYTYLSVFVCLSLHRLYMNPKLKPLRRLFLILSLLRSFLVNTFNFNCPYCFYIHFYVIYQLKYFSYLKNLLILFCKMKNK